MQLMKMTYNQLPAGSKEYGLNPEQEPVPMTVEMVHLMRKFLKRGQVLVLS